MHINNLTNELKLYAVKKVHAIVCYTLDKVMAIVSKGKGKVFNGQEPPSGESITTESGVNYQLLSVMH